MTPTPVPQSEFYASSAGASFEQIRGIVHEYARRSLDLLVERGGSVNAA